MSHTKPGHLGLQIGHNPSPMFDIWGGFVKKVYGILTVQLIFTFAAVAGISLTSVADKLWDAENNKLTSTGSIVLWVGFGVYIVTMFMIACGRQIVRKVPGNYILLMVNTVSQTMICVALAAATAPKYVIIAALMTVLITFVLTIYACKTKDEINYKGALWYILIWYVLMTIAVIVIHFCYLPLYAGYIIVSVLVIALYGFFIIWDTRMIINGRRGTIDVDDYIFGAALLYSDIIGLFIQLLGAGGSR